MAAPKWGSWRCIKQIVPCTMEKRRAQLRRDPSLPTTLPVCFKLITYILMRSIKHSEPPLWISGLNVKWSWASPETSVWIQFYFGDMHSVYSLIATNVSVCQPILTYLTSVVMRQHQEKHLTVNLQFYKYSTPNLVLAGS